MRWLGRSPLMKYLKVLQVSQTMTLARDPVTTIGGIRSLRQTHQDVDRLQMMEGLVGPLGLEHIMWQIILIYYLLQGGIVQSTLIQLVLVSLLHPMVNNLQ